MNLVMVSRSPLEELEQLAMAQFNGVPNKNSSIKDFSSETVFDENSLGHIFKMIPNKNIKKLDIEWILPFSFHMWKSKPTSYISHIIGHEGPNSLLSHLIKEGLVTSLTCSNSHRMRCID